MCLFISSKYLGFLFIRLLDPETPQFFLSFIMKKPDTTGELGCNLIKRNIQFFLNSGETVIYFACSIRKIREMK